MSPLLALANVARTRRGRRKLKRRPSLDRVASAYARRMAREGFFDHRDFSHRVRPLFSYYSVVAENLARASGRQPAVRVAIGGWLRSPAHRRALLNPRFRYAGVGKARGGNHTYWVMLFAAPK